jgi:hypothetical protein
LASTNNLAPLTEKRTPFFITCLIHLRCFRCSSRGKQFCPRSASSPARLSLVRFVLVRNTQLSPAFCPAPLQNKPAPSCGHTGAEAEFTVPLNFAGLISTFHYRSPSYFMAIGRRKPSPRPALCLN